MSLSDERQRRPITGPGSTGTCPFCQGPKGEVGERSFHVAVFDNQFPAFHNPGRAEVIIYSSEHFDDIGYLSAEHGRLIWTVWQDRTREAFKDSGVVTPFIFENRGQRVGATISHPHGQLYGYPFIPPRIEQELAQSRCGLCQETPLVVAEGKTFAVTIPYALRMPYHMRLAPKRHVGLITDLTNEESHEGMAMLQALVRTYDRWFGFRAVYVMALYQEPRGFESKIHMRFEFLPVARDYKKWKYIAGSELGMGIFISDMFPENILPTFQKIFSQEWGK